MEGLKSDYVKLRDNLIGELCEYGSVIDKLSPEDNENNHKNIIIENVNETVQKLLSQIRMYKAFFELQNNIKKITDNVFH